MKFEQPPQDVAVHGDFPTSDYAVGDLAFILDMFADKVYTYKERAVIRELSCNAHDSHVMAGTTDINFDIHLPTHLEPWFSLRDYGTGLDNEEVRSIFAGIGISTKRNSNETIGCFGIGSLSPYSLCDSFTVKSWKDGMVRIYSCYRDEERKPKVALLNEEATDEPNGVEVSLNIEGRISKFEQEALNVFKWWDYTPNINNQGVIESCEKHRACYDFVGEDYSLNTAWGNMVAVMGNIAYAIPNELDEFDCDGFIRFELGEINFDTARENLSLDDKTRAAIKAKFDRIRNEIGDEAIAKVEQGDTPYKRAVLADTLSRGQVGQLIVSKSLSQFKLPESTKPMTYWKRARYRGGSSDKSETHNLPLSNKAEYYLHKDRMQARIRHYLKEVADRDICLVILTDEQVDEVLLDRDLLLDMDDLPKVPLSANHSGGSGSKVKTFVFKTGSLSPYSRDQGDYYDETEIEDNGQEMVYVEINRWQPVDGNGSISGCNRQIGSSINTMKENGIDVPVVLGLKSAFVKTAKFDGGNFIHFDDFMKREFQKIAPKTCYLFSDSDAKKVREIAKIMENDELTEFVDLIDSNKNDQIADVCRRIGIKNSIEEDTSVQEWMDSFFEKHELLTLLTDWEIRQAKEKVARYIGATIKSAI
jgi:hypothetical protein